VHAHDGELVGPAGRVSNRLTTTKTSHLAQMKTLYIYQSIVKHKIDSKNLLKALKSHFFETLSLH